MANNITKVHVRRTLENAIEMLEAVKAAVEAGYGTATPTTISQAQQQTLVKGGLAVGKGGTGCSC